MSESDKPKLSLTDINRKLQESLGDQNLPDESSPSIAPIQERIPEKPDRALPADAPSPSTHISGRPDIRIADGRQSPPFQHLRPNAQTSPITSFSQDEEESSEFDLTKYVRVILENKNVIILTIIVATIFSAFLYLKTAKVYSAHAHLLFSPRYQDIMVDNGQTPPSEGSRFNTHLELLKSQTVLDRVASGLNNGLDAKTIAGGLKITRGTSGTEKNDIVDVCFSYKDAAVAQDVANAVCRTYVEYIKEVNVQDVSQLILKLDDQIAKVGQDLEKKENALREFKESNRSVELSSEANQAISKLSEVEASFQQTQLDIVNNNERLASLKKEIDQQEVDIIQSYTNPYQDKLAELELQLNTLSAENSPEHFQVRIIKDQIEKLKAAMSSDMNKEAGSKTFIKNPIRQSLLQDFITATIDHAGFDAKKSAQERILKGMDAQLQKLPGVELQYAQLTRETESLLEVLKLLKSRYEEAKIKRDSQDSDLKILEEAQPETTVVSGAKVSQILIAALIGLIIGIALAFLLDYLDQSIKEPQEVEKRLELPLLGMVPYIEGEKAIIDSSKEEFQSIWEPLRTLRATLKHIAENRRIKTIMICSALKGEGKTTLTSNIGIMFAIDGKKVILVDADLRRQKMQSVFRLPPKNGLSDYLLGNAEIKDILKPTEHPNLFVITAGEHAQSPAELVGSYKFDLFIKELREMADYVIFDSPALLLVSDTCIMAPKVDACIMVVRALWTPTKAALQAKAQMQRMGCSIIGAIMNVVTSAGYYYYGYAYYGKSLYAKYGKYEKYGKYGKYEKYEDEGKKKDAGFSMRKFGLNVESRFKGAFLALQPWIVSSRRFVRHLMKRKMFWVLVVLAVLLLLANSIMRSLGFGIQPKAPVTHPGAQQNGPASSLLSNAPGAPQAGSVQTAPGGQSAVLSQIRDSLYKWEQALNQKAVGRALSFYDSASFRSPGGDYRDFKTSMENKLLPDSLHYIIHIDSIGGEPAQPPYVNTEVRLSMVSSTDTAKMTLHFTWQNIRQQWKIVNQSAKFP